MPIDRTGGHLGVDQVHVLDGRRCERVAERDHVGSGVEGKQHGLRPVLEHPTGDQGVFDGVHALDHCRPTRLRFSDDEFERDVGLGGEAHDQEVDLSQGGDRGIHAGGVDHFDPQPRPPGVGQRSQHARLGGDDGEGTLRVQVLQLARFPGEYGRADPVRQRSGGDLIGVQQHARCGRLQHVRETVGSGVTEVGEIAPDGNGACGVRHGSAHPREGGRSASPRGRSPGVRPEPDRGCRAGRRCGPRRRLRLPPRAHLRRR